MIMTPLDLSNSKPHQPESHSATCELRERIARLERENITLAAEKTALQGVVASLRYQLSISQQATTSNSQLEGNERTSRLLHAEV